VPAKEHNLDNLWFDDQVYIRSPKAVGHGYCSKDSRHHQYTVETRMIEQCSMSLGSPLLVWSRDFCFFCFGRGKGVMVLLCFFAYFPRKGILNFIAHGSIIRVFTVCEGASRSGEVFDFHESIHGWAGEVIVPRLRRAAATPPIFAGSQVTAGDTLKSARQLDVTGQLNITLWVATAILSQLEANV